MFNSHTVLFYDQALPHSNKSPHFNLMWVTLTPFAIYTWLENQTHISGEVSVTQFLDNWQTLSVHMG